MKHFHLRLLPCLLLIVVLSLGQSVSALERPDNPDDAWIAGAMTVFLEQKLGWPKGSYRLMVRNGLVTVVIPGDAPERRAQLETAQPPVDGIAGINIMVGDVREPLSKIEQRVYSFMGLAQDTIPFPTGDIFWPLLADPKQPDFFVSARRYHTEQGYFTTAAVGYGETFGLYRRAGQRPEEGLQIGIMGGLFAQFDLGAPSADLVNADYTIGVPVTFRKGRESMRFRLYHQSSHLGDEFLLRVNPVRVNLSFEALEYLYSYDLDRVRLYGGGEYMVHRDPSDLKPFSLHTGAEYRGRNVLWHGGRWLAAIDMKNWQEHNWSPDIRVIVGPEFGPPQPGRRRMRVVLEGYRGYNPHGQFYTSRISYMGLGIYLGF
jgi:hypothetical protein